MTLAVAKHPSYLNGMKWIAALIPLSLVAGCFADETLRGHGAADKIWVLAEARDFTATPSITLTFPEQGRIVGQAPCNSYGTTMDVPYPWFETGPIAATKRACPELETEVAFFDALGSATLSEVFGNTLMLSDDDGMLMVFRSDG
ncbi:META domain-containing protein [Sulfitobacter mediterraneus]|uniref:META domain-containing protein n=1 Tax=Sulfitobacter mediterraneus TaxID=83219 RepID=UPI001EEEBE22|nr:META domain-containing protein [Sulfitobacter mediterraneus]MCD2361295.1 META domain-containing protein [Sulfitobacter mediterraneus]